MVPEIFLFVLGETSCPYQIRSTSNPQKERKRFPDAIGIGTAKSGTGSIAFLDCHSKIRFRAFEPNVFPIPGAGREIPKSVAEVVYSNHGWANGRVCNSLP